MANNSTMILSARGAFYQVSLAENAAGATKSFYAIDKLTINPDSTSPDSPILLDGIRYRNSDIVSRVPCLNNFKVYYSFGQNFGDISISGSVLLGPLGGVKTDGVDRLIKWFNTYRVSVYGQAIAVHIVDQAYYVYIEGMQIMEADKEFNILPFAIFGTQIDISGNNSNLINPSTEVLSDVNLDRGSLATALSVVPPSQLNAPAVSTTAPVNSDENNPYSINQGANAPAGGGEETAASQVAANQASSTSTPAAQLPNNPANVAGTSTLSAPAPMSAAGIVSQQQDNDLPPTATQQAYSNASTATVQSRQAVIATQAAAQQAATSDDVAASAQATQNYNNALATYDANVTAQQNLATQVVTEANQQNGTANTLAGTTPNADAIMLQQFNSGQAYTAPQYDYQAATRTAAAAQQVVDQQTADGNLTPEATANLQAAQANQAALATKVINNAK